MSDSLVLKGVKSIQNHSGSELNLAYCKRGGDTHMLKRWWTKSTGNVIYVACTVFNINAGATAAKLVVETKPESRIKIEHDGNLNFTFSGYSGIKHIGLFTADYQLIEAYELGSVPGAVVKVTPGDASRPSYIGELSYTGEIAELAIDTNSSTITASISGNASPVTYSWAKVSGPGKATFTAKNSAATKVKFDEEGIYSIKCSVASSDPNLGEPSPKELTIDNIDVA
mgnify:CR=1 FL=1